MELAPSRRIVDLTHRLDAATPPWPGDPAPEIGILCTVDLPGGAPRARIESSALRTSLHCGTHMDAPFHFFSDGCTIDRVGLEACIGPATLVRPGRLAAGTIERAGLEPHAEEIRAARRVILDTGWHRRWGEPDYFTAYPVIAEDAARFLVDCGVVLVGVDFPSVDRPPHATHQILLGAGVLIVENLARLDALPAGRCDFVALPLKVGGRDGSPVRAVAMIDGADGA